VVKISLLFRNNIFYYVGCSSRYLESEQHPIAPQIVVAVNVAVALMTGSICDICTG